MTIITLVLNFEFRSHHVLTAIITSEDVTHLNGHLVFFQPDDEIEKGERKKKRNVGKKVNEISFLN